MYAQLICLDPDKSGLDRFVLEIGVHVLGRSSAADFVVNDSTISRRHARITATDGRILVSDLRSLNGTFIDDARVRSDAAIAGGQRLRCGAVRFLLKVSRPPEPETDSVLGTEPCVRSSPVSPIAPTLSRAQDRVLQQLLQGIAEKQIAARLRISQHTVHNHVRAIFRSFGVHSRLELLATFLRRPSAEKG